MTGEKAELIAKLLKRFEGRTMDEVHKQVFGKTVTSQLNKHFFGVESEDRHYGAKIFAEQQKQKEEDGNKKT